MARLDQDNLVAADAGVAIGEHDDLRRGQRQRRVARVEYDEVVAEAVHLGEGAKHDLPVAPPLPRRQRIPPSARRATQPRGGVAAARVGQRLRRSQP